MRYTQVPTIDVGIVLKQAEICFTLNGDYQAGHRKLLSGQWRAVVSTNQLVLTGDRQTIQLPEGSVLEPAIADASFTLHDVTIGIGFHWERREDQTFTGALRLIVEQGQLTAVNRLSLEDYLVSVISSEMSATSSAALLRAHAVISRSWLLAQMQKNNALKSMKSGYQTTIETAEERIRWYDREDHDRFDVCADDHCQRYQGITRASTPQVEQAIRDTFGEALTYQDKVCDARFSKCCGGMMERFENVWEPQNHPYLQKRIDSDHEPAGFDTELTKEPTARQWILGRPEAFCNTANPAVLSQVLNDYDQETNDFYRWEVRYSQAEVSELIKKRIGLDVGLVQDFEPVERGDSGRLIKLKIIGSKQTKIIGKELEIRKALSKSHLYSSAIVFEKESQNGEVVFVLKGAGWGHGVGLCQIGAAVMGARGYEYRQILAHYFPGATLKKLYA